jgi:transposase
VKKKDRKTLGRYCRDLADKLELRDWWVSTRVGDPGGPDGRYDGKRWGASCESIPGQKHVKVVFDPECRDWRREELRKTVTHELIHAHLAPLTEMVRVDLQPHLGAQGYHLFDDGFTRHLEFAVDALADAVAPSLPLIEWPKGKATQAKAS